MLKKIFYYGRENNKKTVLSIFLLVIAIFLSDSHISLCLSDNR